MKKTLTLIFIGAMLGSTVAFGAVKIFSDVPQNAWYAHSVFSLAEKGIIQGYPDGTYGPGNYVNRAELATMLDRMIEYIETGEVEIPEPSVKTGDLLESLSANWNLYTNYDQGYSLKVPKQANIYTCDTFYNNKLGIWEDMEAVPVKVIKEDNISFITHEYIYDYETCEKTYATSIPDERRTWKIISRNIAGMNDLEEFVQEMYGEGCTIEKVETDGFVNINTTDPEGGCFINYVSSIKYNEANNKAYSFDIGQDTNFYLDEEYYDMEMMESFTFLD